jgi:outer membrane protein OmpA-like peptidoglycan-associated protein
MDEVQTAQGKKYLHKFVRDQKKSTTGDKGGVDDKPPFGDKTAPGTTDVTSMDRLLYDFDVNWPELKDEHRAWIAKARKFIKKDFDQRAKTGASYGAWEVRIDGYASKTFKGDADQGLEYNQVLSELRKNRVANEFKTNLNPTVFHFVEGFHGFKDPPVPGTGEFDKHRSVRVVVQRPGLPPPPPVDLYAIDVSKVCWNYGPYVLKNLSEKFGFLVPVPDLGISAGPSIKAMTIQDIGCSKFHQYKVKVGQAGIGLKAPIELVQKFLSVLRAMLQAAKKAKIVTAPSPSSTVFIKNPARLDLTVTDKTFEGGITIVTGDAGTGTGLMAGIVAFSKIPLIGLPALNPLNIKGFFLIGGADITIGANATASTGMCTEL